MSTLWVVATPIGNLQDLTPRSVEALASADFWLVEDTRISGKLQSHLGLRKPMKLLNEHTTDAQIDRHLESIEQADSVAILTDAGTPGISDPGARLIDRAYDQGILVDAAPGASAVTTALALSGFFAQQFAFLGFLGRKAGDLRSSLEPFTDSTLSLVLFESPHRFLKTLEGVAHVLGERRYAICRELTKSHQQVYRDTLPQLPSPTQVPSKGEFTLVIEGKRRKKMSEKVDSNQNFEGMV